MISKRPSVLISAISAPYNKPFLPYMWAILKTHWERNGVPDAYDWLPPLFLNAEPDELLAPYDLSNVSVVGLNCYIWNFKLQCAIAQRVKAANPRAFIVAGGPEPDCKDGLFFARHPYIDAVCAKDGEVTFTKILSKLLLGSRDVSDVPGLTLPTLGGAAMRSTGPAELPRSFDESPYVAQSAYFETIKRSITDFNAIFETNRGCPYSCSFCDWGSNTMSKIRQFSLERVKAELDWFAWIGVKYLVSVDANFGILARDLEIADALCAAYRRHGYPSQFHYSAAKNHPERAVAIAAKLAETGLCRSHILAVQHTRPKVLEATARKNISPAKQVEAARALMSRNIPIDVQLIAGIPGDSYEEWTHCFGDLMEWGIHDDYTVFLYSLLPNAPAAAKEFVDKWKIKTVDRAVLPDPNHVWFVEPVSELRAPVSHVVVESSTFTREDWVRMCAYGAVVKALHCGGVTRLISMYLRWTHAVPYVAFYRSLIEECVSVVKPWADYYSRVMDSYARFTIEPDAGEFMRLDRLPEYPHGLEASRWIFANACMDFPAGAAALREYLLEKYSQVPPLHSVIDYQFNLVIRPGYDPAVGAEFGAEYDWIEYFKGTKGRTGSEYQPEPKPVAGAVVRISDSAKPLSLTWGGDPDVIWSRWVARLVEQRHSDATRNFQWLSLEYPKRIAACIRNDAAMA
jgi:putative methyltransferase